MALRTMFAVLVAAGIFAADPASAVMRPEQPWTPTTEAVRHIESMVQMPGGAQPKDAYVRFYAGVTDDKGRKVIEGVYLVRSIIGDMNLNVHGDINIVAAQNMPFINDGGCYMVTVYYDVASDKITQARCNGYA